MKTVRYTAAIATLLMGLFNLPVAFDSAQDIPRALGILITLLGVVGIGAAVALLAKVSWGPLAVVAVGVVNLIGAVYALATGLEGGVIGLVLNLVIVGLGGALLRLQAARASQPIG